MVDVDELRAALKKKEFTWSPVQGLLTLALKWCRDNNEHGKEMPGEHAAALLKAGILFWDPKHEMYDIIEPIKSWLEPHRIEKNPFPIPGSCKYCNSNRITIPPNKLINRGMVSGYYPPKCMDCGKFLYPEEVDSK